MVTTLDLLRAAAERGETIPAATLRQPFAGLTAIGHKRIETRVRRMLHVDGGPGVLLAVIAGLGPDLDCASRYLARVPVADRPWLVRKGVVVAVVRVVDVRPLVAADEDRACFFAPNRWAHVLSPDVVRVDHSRPARGALWLTDVRAFDLLPRAEKGNP